MTAELALSAEREAALAKELGRCKAECCELQTKLTNAVESASKAKKAAREALIDMAEQNAKLVAAYVEKKREVKQLQAAAKEDRKLWQQRLQRMELELQANKLHITGLMQQLHAIAAKQAYAEQAQPAASPEQDVAPEQLNSPGDSPAGARYAGSVESCSTSRADCSPAEVTSRTPHSFAPGSNPLRDATNTVSSNFKNASKPLPNKHSSHQQPSSNRNEAYVPFDSVSDEGLASATGPAKQQTIQDQKLTRDQGDQQQQYHSQQQPSQQDSDMHSRLLQRLAGRTSSAHHAPGISQQQHCDAVDAQQQQQALQQQQQAAQELQEQHKQQQVLTQLHKEQQQKEQQLMELQHRAEELEVENAALRAAQAEAEALKNRVQRMQEAEQLKQRGNRHFQSQQYQQASLAYSEALALSVEDPTFNAVLLCNRAAALHSLGQYLEAIADCCMAAQLDDRYPRVLQRRAEAYMAIEDYGSAVADLQQLTRLNSSSREAAQKLKDAQQKQRAQGTAGPNYYLVLGLQQDCSTAEVKAAYKKLALRYHPDKASGGAYAKSSSEAVFVLITAANSTLSDPARRAAYDAAQQAVRIRRSMNISSSGGIHNHRHMGRDASSSSSHGGIYNWHYPQATAGFGGSYAAAAEAAKAAAAAAATAAAAAEQSRWRHNAPQGRQPSHSQCGSQSRDSGASNSSTSTGATYPASRYS